MNPSSHAWFTKFGYTVFPPIILPFGKGWGRPQSTAEDKHHTKQGAQHNNIKSVSHKKGKRFPMSCKLAYSTYNVSVAVQVKVVI